ncbi:hypothetical protein LPJ63_001260 [Coemansia sp. RSA 2711]|nr:hypothetical protein LPJ63_001260 [Coemansia sp. RSA 2711]KAJ2298467.1 hypothetical protein IWW54_006634 [Coemansia sp. RSA 2705]
MAMVEPCARFNPNCNPKPELPQGVEYDYSITNPIPYSGPLTKTDTPWPKPVATWTAGEEVTVKFDPAHAAHGGGNLAIAVSLDGGKTSVMVFQRLRYAFFNGPSSSNTPEVTEYTFKLPADLPSCDNAVISWIWYNRLGEREMYRDDSDVKLIGSGSKSFTGPELVIANHEGYPTIPESDYEAGVDLFENAKNITITVEGGSSDAGGASDKSSGESPAASSDAGASSAAATSVADSASVAVSADNSVPAEPGSVSAEASLAESSPASEANGSAAASDAADTDESAAASDAAGTDAAQDKGASSDGESCTSGLMQCSGNGYKVCQDGKWSPEYACGVGTVCRGGGGHIYCDLVSSSSNA